MDVAVRILYGEHQSLCLRKEANNVCNITDVMVASGGDANVAANWDACLI